LDDYAFLLAAILEVLQNEWHTEHLQFATQLADALLAHFLDRDAGGFFFTADDHEALILRSKTFSDEAVPAGSGVATFNIQTVPGVTAGVANDTLTAAYNDLPAVSFDKGEVESNGPDDAMWMEVGAVRRLPVFGVTAIDTLGAGDAFHGGFALALAEGHDPVAAMRFGAATAALKCTRFGGISGTPDRAEVEAFLEGQIRA